LHYHFIFPISSIHTCTFSYLHTFTHSQHRILCASTVSLPNIFNSTLLHFYHFMQSHSLTHLNHYQITCMHFIFTYSYIPFHFQLCTLTLLPFHAIALSQTTHLNHLHAFHLYILTYLPFHLRNVTTFLLHIPLFHVFIPLLFHLYTLALLPFHFFFISRTTHLHYCRYTFPIFSSSHIHAFTVSRFTYFHHYILSSLPFHFFHPHVLSTLPFHLCYFIFTHIPLSFHAIALLPLFHQHTYTYIHCCRFTSPTLSYSHTHVSAVSSALFSSFSTLHTYTHSAISPALFVHFLLHTLTFLSFHFLHLFAPKHLCLFAIIQPFHARLFMCTLPPPFHCFTFNTQTSPPLPNCNY